MGNALVSPRAFFPPSPPSYTAATLQSRGIYMPVAGGLPAPGTEEAQTIPAIFLPQPGATKTLIFSHGNAEDLGQLVEWLQPLGERAGVNVVAYDYCGFGPYKGTPSEKGCYHDIATVYAHVRDQLQVPVHDIVLMGRSIGSGPTTHLASTLCAAAARDGKPSPLHAVVLQSPIASVLRVVSAKLWPLGVVDVFVNISKIGAVNVPLCIVHGDQDEVVPFAHGEALYAEAKSAPHKLFVPIAGAGHNNIETTRESLALLVDGIRFAAGEHDPVAAGPAAAAAASGSSFASSASTS